MKNRLFLTVIAINLLLFSSCEKDNNEAANPLLGIPKINTQKMYINDELSVSFTYEYNSLGKVSKMTQNEEYTIIQYQNNMIYFQNYDANGNLLTTDTAFLNTDGLIESMSFTYGDKIFDKTKPFFKKNNKAMQTATYEYDSDGFLIKLTIKNSEQTIIQFFTIENENTVKTKITSETDTITAYFTFNDQINTIGSYNTGMDFFGKQNKNLYDKYTTEMIYNGQVNSYDTNVTYEFDDKNRVTKMTESGKYYVTCTYY